MTDEQTHIETVILIGNYDYQHDEGHLERYECREAAIKTIRGELKEIQLKGVVRINEVDYPEPTDLKIATTQDVRIL